MRCITYWVKKPLQGRSRRADRHWSANVGVWRLGRIGREFSSTNNNRNKIIQPWKVGWPSAEKILDPQTEIGGICWIFLSTESRWFSSLTLWMQKINWSRHFSPLLSFKSFATSLHELWTPLLGRSYRANRSWGAIVWDLELGTDWTGTCPSISWGRKWWKCGASTFRFCWCQHPSSLLVPWSNWSVQLAGLFEIWVWGDALFKQFWTGI